MLKGKDERSQSIGAQAARRPHGASSCSDLASSTSVQSAAPAQSRGWGMRSNKRGLCNVMHNKPCVISTRGPCSCTRAKMPIQTGEERRKASWAWKWQGPRLKEESCAKPAKSCREKEIAR